MLRHSRLANGLTIVTVNVPKKLGTVAVFANTGSRSETPETNGVAHFLEHMAFKGTKTRSSFQITNETEFLGGQPNAYTSTDTTCYYTSGLVKHQSIFLRSLADIMMNSTFQEDLLDIERGAILQEYAMYNDNPDDLAANKAMALAFPDHPLGFPIIGSEENIKSFKSKDMFDFMRDRYVTSNMAIAASGEIDHDEFVKEVEDVFSGLKVGTWTPENKEISWKGGVGIVQRPDLNQVCVKVVFPAAGACEELTTAQSVYTQALGGGMSAPLFQEIREKRGLVYGVGSYAYTLREEGVFIVEARTTPDNVEEVLRLMTIELKKGRDLGQRDFERAKNSTLVSIASLQDKPFGFLSHSLDNYFTSGKFKTSEEMYDDAENVSIDDVRFVAEQLLKEKPVIALAGPVPELDYEAIYASI